MVNVSQAMKAEGHGFQVFLAFQNDTRGDKIDGIEEDAQSTFGGATVRSIRVENKGADIGPLLRQLQVLGRESPEKHHDIFLKIHTKSSSDARHDMLRNLCGSPEIIRKLCTRLRQSKSVGMVGPPGHVWAAPWVQKQDRNGTRVKRRRVAWQVGEVAAMQRTWDMIHPPMTFENGARQKARIITGSFYWAREEALLYDIILRSVDTLLGSMSHGYVKGSCCTTAHGLERVIPTLAVTVLGLDVVSMEEFVH
jgi:lipopolysaccharide biosynthesis protein